MFQDTAAENCKQEYKKNDEKVERKNRRGMIAFDIGVSE